MSMIEFAINSAISQSIDKASFELLYEYLSRSFSPIVFDFDNSASMNFIEQRMLSQLSAQDSIIAAKTEQSYYTNKHRKDDSQIAVDNSIIVSNESQLSHLPKGRQKLATKWVGPYKVTKVDRSKSNYTLDIQDSKRQATFHVSNVKKYVDQHHEMFPNRQRRQPRIVLAEQDLNIEIEKIIGHERLRNGTIRFLCKWEGFPNEDATYRTAEDFKTSPYGRQLVKNYISGFGECPKELSAWVERTEWIRKDVEDKWRNHDEGIDGSPSALHLRLELKRPSNGKTRIFPRRREDVGFMKLKPYGIANRLRPRRKFMQRPRSFGTLH